MTTTLPRVTGNDEAAAEPPAELLRDALALGRARRRLEDKREALTAETDRVILELHDVHGFPAVVLADLLGVSKQRMSQLLTAARERRDSAVPEQGAGS